MAEDKKNTDLSTDVNASSLMTSTKGKQVIAAPVNPSETAKKLAVALQRNQSADVAAYGIKPQNSISAVADKATKSISTIAMGEVGNQLTQLMVTLKTSLPEDKQPKSMLGKLLFKAKRKGLEVKGSYQSVGTTITSISNVLEESSQKLRANNNTLRILFDDNRQYYAQLSDYIDGGLLRLHQIDTVDLPAAIKKVDDAGSGDKDLAAQNLNQLQNYRNRLSQRVYSLQLSQQLALQQTAQINLIANNNNLMQDKINDAVQISIPMWKEQAAHRLAINDLQRAQEASKLVKEATEYLVKDNANVVKNATLEAAKQSQEGFISEEALMDAQRSLVDAISGYQRTMEEGARKRAGATARLKEQTEKMRQQISEASRRTVDAEVNDNYKQNLIENQSDPFSIDD